MKESCLCTYERDTEVAAGDAAASARLHLFLSHVSHMIQYDYEALFLPLTPMNE